jgi:Cdc6-like AAA superfamily ATPase
MLSDFPYSSDGEATEARFRLGFALAVGLVLGPATAGLAWLLRRRRLGWQLHTGLLAVALLWLVLVAPEVQAADGAASAVLGGGIGRMLLVLWVATIPLAPLAALAMRAWDGLVHLLRPRSLQEQLQEQAARLEQKNRQLSRRAERHTRQPAQAGQGRLALGVFMKGDRFAEGLGVAQDRDGWVLLDERLLSQHLLVVGTTGAGKSVTLTRLMAEVLRATDRDVFVIDGKGDTGLAEDVANLLYAAGRGPVPVFRLGLAERGSVYHGFCGQAQDIYNRLCALVGVGEAEGGAQFYADVNRDLLQLVCYAPPGPPRSFEEVRRRLNHTWLLDAYAGHADELATLESMDPRLLAGLTVRLRPLVREFAPLIGPEGFALETCRGAVFSLRTQSVGDTARRFLDFLVEDVKDFVGKRQKRPGLLIIDEFGAFNNENIVDLLTLARSSDLGVVLATQDVASLGDERVKRLILANTRTKLLMASDFPEELAELAGTIYQIEASAQHLEGDPTGMGSARVQHAFRVDMNEAARLAAGEAFVIRQRQAAKLKVAQPGAIGRDPQAVARAAQRRLVHGKETTLATNGVGRLPVPELDLLPRRAEVPVSPPVSN